MKSRLREIDFVRAFAALSVIAIHVSGAYIYSSNRAYLWNISMRYAVPMFIILSGLVLFYSDYNKENFSSVRFWWKRFKKLLIPYVLWNIIYMIYSSRHDLGAITGNITGFFKVLLHNVLTGTGTYHLYFVLITLQLYFLYPLIRLAAKKYMRASLIVSFLITLFCQTLIYLGAQNKAAIPQTYIPFFILFPVWIFFLVFGMYFSINIDSFKMKISSKSTIIGFLWILSLLLLIIDTRLTNTQEGSVKPSVILYTIFSFLFFYWIGLKASITQNIVGKIMDFLSEQSFLIYFSHVLFLKLISSFSYFIGFGEYWEKSEHQVSLYITTVVVTSIFAYIMSFSSITYLIGGVYKRHLSAILFKKSNTNIKM